jgi:hypothetical protein
MMMPNTVDVIQQDQIFIVRLNENGDVSEKHFETEMYAGSWAAGQAMRLNCAVTTDSADEADIAAP